MGSLSGDQRKQHVALTDAIITLETRMNGLVYDAFKLNADERTLIETATEIRMARYNIGIIDWLDCALSPN